MLSLSSKPFVIIWPKYLQEFAILITVSFNISEVPGFTLNFSGIKYKSTVFCSLNFSTNSQKTVHTLEAIHSFQKQLVTIIPGSRFNIKMTSYQYRKSHCGDKTILRPSYLHHGISYTGKMTSLLLYWIGAQVICIVETIHNNYI